MKRLFLVLGLFLLSGCASKPGVHVWWNPTTWGADRAAAVQDNAAEQKENERKLDLQAMREMFKTRLALRQAPADNRAVQVAQRTADNAYSLLSISMGELELAYQQQDRETIENLLSENSELRAAGEKSQAKAEGVQAKLSADNKKLAEANQLLTKKLEDSYVNERQLANTARNFWFIAIGLVVLWVLGNVLSMAARFNPAFAGVSRLVNGVAAPSLAFAESRATTGLQKVGHAITAVREQLPTLVELAAKDAAKAREYLTTIFDQHTDADHQRAIGAAANIAPRT